MENFDGGLVVCEDNDLGFWFGTRQDTAKQLLWDVKSPVRFIIHGYKVSADRVERTTRLALLEVQEIGQHELEATFRNTM